MNSRITYLVSMILISTNLYTTFENDDFNFESSLLSDKQDEDMREEAEQRQKQAEFFRSKEKHDFDSQSSLHSQYSKETFDSSENSTTFNKKYENLDDNLRSALKSLPQRFRPADIDQALQLMQKGKAVSDLIATNKFYDAIALNLPFFRSSSKAAFHDDRIFKQALNTDDETFWKLIENDPVTAKSIKAHKINFTFEEFQKPENNLYFRNTFIRKNIFSENSLKLYQQAYQASVVQLQWHLFARSMLQDQAFTSGMITFDEPHFQTFKFLDGYAELVSPKYKLHANISVHSLFTTKAYTRTSSHWGGQLGLGGLNCGIDIQDKNGQPLEILPGNKSHMFFGIRKNGMTFVKWEIYGITFNPIKDDISIVKHTSGYFHKKGKEDNRLLERREVTPKIVLEKFEKLYGKKLTKEESKSIEINGIVTLRQLLAQNTPEKSAEFDNFLVDSMGYQPETLNVRKGGEIILPPQPS